MTVDIVLRCQAAEWENGLLQFRFIRLETGFHIMSAKVNIEEGVAVVRVDSSHFLCNRKYERGKGVFLFPLSHGFTDAKTLEKRVFVVRGSVGKGGGVFSH